MREPIFILRSCLWYSKHLPFPFSRSCLQTSYIGRTILHSFKAHTSTMVNRSLLLGALAATVTGVVAQENVRFGNAFSLGATTSYIIEAETTLYPGKTQSGDTPRLALWPGMGTDQGQLIQAIVLGSTDAQGQNCGGKPHVNGQWCVFASALQSGTQLQGATFPINSNQGVKIHCKSSSSLPQTLHPLNKHHRQVRPSLRPHCPNRQCGGQSCLHSLHQIW
jgi:hypothetical protein